MRALAKIMRRPSGNRVGGPHFSPEKGYSLWERVINFAAEIRASDFMAKMARHLDGPHGPGLMGTLDCATLYGLTRWLQPLVVVETGGYLGMSSAFILKAFQDEGLVDARLYSIEGDQECQHGALIPPELRSQFVPLSGSVEAFVKQNKLPSNIDMFLHDSSHRYRHMLWEFQQFWGRLGDGGLLVSHDVHFNAAFAEFVARTHSRDKKGVLDASRATHYEWGRWGYIGFAIKKGA